MGRNDTTSAMIDGLLRFSAMGGMLTTAVIAPGAVILWDKPTQLLFDKLDKRAQEREYRRLVNYMKQRGLITPLGDDYEHGLALTSAGLKRAKRAEIDRLHIPTPKSWDGNWHIVLFDIPEHHKTQRNAFSYKLRLLGFRQLQRSVWVHPFPCREQIEVIAVACDVAHYVTYIDTSYIDNQEELKKRFSVLKTCS